MALNVYLDLSWSNRTFWTCFLQQFTYLVSSKKNTVNYKQKQRTCFWFNNQSEVNPVNNCSKDSLMRTPQRSMVVMRQDGLRAVTPLNRLTSKPISMFSVFTHSPSRTSRILKITTTHIHYELSSIQHSSQYQTAVNWTLWQIENSVCKKK